MKFIELTPANTEKRFLVNIAHIVQIAGASNGCDILLDTRTHPREQMRVKNTYESIVEMLKAHQAL